MGTLRHERPGRNGRRTVKDRSGRLYRDRSEREKKDGSNHGHTLMTGMPRGEPSRPVTHRQVDQMKLADTDVVLPVRSLLTALHRHREDGMGAGTVGVHVSRPYHPYSGVTDTNNVHVITLGRLQGLTKYV